MSETPIDVFIVWRRDEKFPKLACVYEKSDEVEEVADVCKKRDVWHPVISFTLKGGQREDIDRNR